MDSRNTQKYSSWNLLYGHYEDLKKGSFNIVRHLTYPFPNNLCERTSVWYVFIVGAYDGGIPHYKAVLDKTVDYKLSCERLSLL